MLKKRLTHIGRLVLYLAGIILAVVIIPASGFAPQSPQQNRTSADASIFLPQVVRAETSAWVGPSGGSVVALAVSPSDPDILYAGTWGAGVFKSIDGGKTWLKAGQGLTNGYINALAVNPSSPEIVYAGPYKSGLNRSLDGGLTWTSVNERIQPEANIYSIAIDPLSPNRLYISTRGISNNGDAPWNGVVYRSDNHGESWFIILNEVRGRTSQDWAYWLAVHPGAPNMLYAAFHEDAAHFSQDFGINWQALHEGLGDDRSSRSIVIDPRDAQRPTLYMGMWHGEGVYKSDNGGDYWQLKSNGLSGAKIYTMLVDPFNPDVVYAGTFNLGLRKTIDRAESWFSGGLEAERIYSLTASPSQPGQIYAGTWGNGVFRTSNRGESWEQSQAGLNAASVSGFVVDPSHPENWYAGTYGGGVMASTDRGTNWSSHANLPPGRLITGLVALPDQPGTLLALTEASGLFRLDLGSGAGWEKIAAGLPAALSALLPYPPGHPFAALQSIEESLYPELLNKETAESRLASPPLLALAYSAGDPNVLYLGTAGAGVFRSSDGGESWQPAGLPGKTASALAISPENPNLIFAADGAPSGFFFTWQGGEPWYPIDIQERAVYSLLAPPGSPERFLAGTDQGIYQRSESGQWFLAGLEGMSVTALASHPQQPQVLLAGTDGMGVYFSVDRGESWNLLVSLEAGQTVHSFAFDPAQARAVFINTRTHGTLRLWEPALLGPASRGE